MTYELLEKQVGAEWANFLKPFMCPDDKGDCPYDKIGAYLRTQYEGGKKIFPDKLQVFRAFRETPLNKLRVILLATEPYNRPGYSNGLAFSTDQEKLPASLNAIYDAVEADVYNGIDLTRPQRTGKLGRPMLDITTSSDSWTEQGVLLLNCALTTEERVDNAHVDIWRPFTEFVVSNIWRVKRDLVFLAWGAVAKDIVRYKGGPDNDDTQTATGVNVFQSYVLTAEHPVDAITAKRKWRTDNFSRANLIIHANNLGKPIEW